MKKIGLSPALKTIRMIHGNLMPAAQYHSKNVVTFMKKFLIRAAGNIPKFSRKKKLAKTPTLPL